MTSFSTLARVLALFGRKRKARFEKDAQTPLEDEKG